MVNYPSLYQINTRVWLTELSRAARRPMTLDDIPDAELNRLAGIGFDWVWLLSVWQTGPVAQRVARDHQELRKEFQTTLPDLQEEDIEGSGFAIANYTVHEKLGGDAALARLRERLRQRRLRLLLDFVPNHTGLDHPWAQDHPEYYVQGNAADLARAPQNYLLVKRKEGDVFLAHGRDPFFLPWTDTLQLNYGNPAFQEAMSAELMKIAGQCDGVRCDMAMLILPDVFHRTWNIRAQPFWPKAIQRIRERFPDFCLLAEVYWDMEWALQQQGFDYTYDKRLYDRLRERQAWPVREYFHADLDYQSKLVRFLENHDEPRAAAAMPLDVHQAAAVITFLCPGLRFFHQGQLQGHKIRISPHLRRGPDEPVDEKLEQFYNRLLAILRQPVVRRGRWQLLECLPAWDGNWTNNCFLAFAWEGAGGERLLATVNYAPNHSQCYVRLPFPDLGGNHWRFQNLLNDVTYDREGNDLQGRGLFVDAAPWQAFVLALMRRP